MLYTLLMAMFVALGYAEDMEGSAPIGYFSGKVGAGDGDVAYWTWSAEDIKHYLAFDDAVCATTGNETTTSYVVGAFVDIGNAATCLTENCVIWWSTDGTKGLDSKPVAAGNQFDIPLSHATLVQRFFFTYDPCSDEDLTMNVLATASIGMKINARGGIAFAKSVATPSAGPSDVTLLFASFSDLTGSAEWIASGVQQPPDDDIEEDTYLNNLLHPVTHRWPADDHPEINTMETVDFWFESGPQRTGSVGISFSVDWSDTLGEGDMGLYAQVDVPVTGVADEYVLCFNWNEIDAGIASLQVAGLYFDEAVALSTAAEVLQLACEFCNTEDCEASGVGGLEEGPIDIQNHESVPGSASSVVVTTFIQKASSEASERHSVCYAWGSECSPGVNAVPSLLAVALLALYKLF
jgi:hypothetical protein